MYPFMTTIWILAALLSWYQCLNPSTCLVGSPDIKKWTDYCGEEDIKERYFAFLKITINRFKRVLMGNKD